ncbi:YmfQ family protein [Agathobaculum butyriciproducens]|uniref:YmfQ family protein n=1 Tax=Agathobaculum butyriciproducens TaxID=1628085 RepID=UPI0020981292|nr:YmfQ family protein [Agathobaculum butyriciproducens]
MAEFDNMLRSLPVAYRTDKWVCDLLAAIQSLDDTQREQMLDITQQLFPGSMTWALAIEERDAGLASTGTLEERRTALIARWRAAGKCDVELIQRVCDSWKNGEISVGFAEGVIVLTFVGAYGVPEAAELAALQEAVDRTIPCHLAVSYLYRYLLVREVDGMTLDELQGHTMHDFAF